MRPRFRALVFTARPARSPFLSWVASASRFAIALLGTPACGDDAVTCGPGTSLQGSVCVGQDPNASGKGGAGLAAGSGGNGTGTAGAGAGGVHGGGANGGSANEGGAEAGGKAGSDSSGKAGSASGGSAGGGGKNGGGATGGSEGSPWDGKKKGDPCPTLPGGDDQHPPVCQGETLLGCYGPRVTTIACDELGGTCVDGSSAKWAHCGGGALAACDQATDRPKCVGTVYVHCEIDGWVPEDCAASGAGLICTTSSSSGDAYCVPPGATSCSGPDVPTCDEEGHILRCLDGLLLTISCADLGRPTWVCGGTANTDAACIPPGTTPCPAGFKGLCAGEDAAVTCDELQTFELTKPCEAGKKCRTTGAGWSECLAPDEVDCDEATFKRHCDGPISLRICSSGHEASSDCPAGYCKPNPPNHDSCVFAQACDPSSYEGTCGGSIAKSCNDDGFVVETNCSNVFPPASCTVTDGKAICE